jgi:DNA mismatch repair protein MutS
MPEPSPMMAQYQGVKSRYPGHLVLFRVGDFYETFGEDAHTLSRDAEVVLTSRQMDGAGQRIPLAGVPHHAVESYLAKLVRKGHRVVVCDQVEDAKAAKGLVRREVVRVVTPGTVLEEGLLPRNANNFLAVLGDAAPGVEGSASERCAVLVDVSTGESLLFRRPASDSRALLEELAPWVPSEVLLPPGALEGGTPLEPTVRTLLPGSRLAEAPSATIPTELPPSWGAVAETSRAAADALGRAAAYVRATEPRVLPFLSRPVARRPNDRMGLDLKTLRHLEIAEPMNPGPERSTTLLDVVNGAITAPGRRTVDSWVRSPLVALAAIRERHDAVEALRSRGTLLLALASELKDVGDLSRLTARLIARRGGPRELLALSRSLRALPRIRATLQEQGGELPTLLARTLDGLDPRATFSEMLARSLQEEVPATAREGGVLRSDAFPELQQLRRKEEEARSAMAALERREAEATGIRSLKIGYTQVFGFYFEVTKTHLAKAPLDRWRRKQTLAAGERFTSEELERWEREVLSSSDRSREVEGRLYEEVLASVEREGPALRATSEALGTLDALVNFARLAHERGWTRPSMVEGRVLKIREGRHPMLERSLGPAFVPNDTDLDAAGLASPRLLLLTGPNMAGKSTYMRQVGLLVVLAQSGSFVPARFAEVGVVSSLHTRMGFTDDIGRGKSSFMVEMGEVAEILRDSDGGSLVLLDEVGRGTSTSDGLAIAWGVVKYLHDAIGARALVATHYHALCEFVEGLKHARNAHLAVREEKGQITFLRTLLPGATEKSYGVHVAELAGIPPAVLEEARRVLRSREPEPLPRARAAGRSGPSARPAPRYTQALLVDDPEAERARELLRELITVPLEHLTPLEALTLLHRMQQQARGKSPPSSGVAESADPAT